MNPWSVDAGRVDERSVIVPGGPRSRDDNTPIRPCDSRLVEMPVENPPGIRPPRSVQAAPSDRDQSLARTESCPLAMASTHALQERDTAGLHPLGDEDVTVLVEAGVVRVDEFARGPPVGLGADPETVEHLLGPRLVVTQMDHDVIVLVEQGDAGEQVGHQQHLAPDVEVGREALTVFLHAHGLAVERDVLEPMVGPVGDDEVDLTTGPVIEPDAVRRLVPARGGAAPPKVRTHRASLSYSWM